MFNKLVIIELDKNGAAGWDPETHDIAIDIIEIMGDNDERDLKWMVDKINVNFLTEFICMEMCGGTEGIADCKKVIKDRCMPHATARDMSSKTLSELKKFYGLKLP